MLGRVLREMRTWLLVLAVVTPGVAVSVLLTLRLH